MAALLGTLHSGKEMAPVETRANDREENSPRSIAMKKLSPRTSR